MEGHRSSKPRSEGSNPSGGATASSSAALRRAASANVVATCGHILFANCPYRLMAQDPRFSVSGSGFESPWGRQTSNRQNPTRNQTIGSNPIAATLTAVLPNWKRHLIVIQALFSRFSHSDVFYSCRLTDKALAYEASYGGSNPSRSANAAARRLVIGAPFPRPSGSRRESPKLAVQCSTHCGGATTMCREAASSPSWVHTPAYAGAIPAPATGIQRSGPHTQSRSSNGKTSGCNPESAGSSPARNPSGPLTRMPLAVTRGEARPS